MYNTSHRIEQKRAVSHEKLGLSSLRKPYCKRKRPHQSLLKADVEFIVSFAYFDLNDPTATTKKLFFGLTNVSADDQSLYE